nr:NADH dehydrogenase subunit 4L [Nezumia stelgidolepis]WNH37083.1 NADH dehydrogenase subunit 4L [Nezumia sclerorhynchus]WNH38411.1 NADH dehydrogenase subunit 4L [Nezumia stelgidolepis]
MTPINLTTSLAFILTFLGLTFYRTHIMSALICLEGMMLALFSAFSLWALQSDSPNFTPAPMCVLAFSACEASAGLALVVATTRTHGSDHLKKLNLLTC